MINENEERRINFETEYTQLCENTQTHPGFLAFNETSNMLRAISIFFPTCVHLNNECSLCYKVN